MPSPQIDVLPVPAAESRRDPTLRECAAAAARRYLADLRGATDARLFEVLLTELERGLLPEVLRHVGGNQSQAARLLGISRGTLRKKLCEHGFEP